MCHKWELLQNAKYKYYSTNELLMCEFLAIQTNLSTPRSQEKMGKDTLENNLLSPSPDPQVVDGAVQFSLQHHGKT